jgi:hypothetical protein
MVRRERSFINASNKILVRFGWFYPVKMLVVCGGNGTALRSEAVLPFVVENNCVPFVGAKERFPFLGGIPDSFRRIPDDVLLQH